VYQGEELGLADAPIPDSARQDPVYLRTKGEQLGRDAARVPLPWSGDRPPYGFSDDPSAVTWLPQPANWEAFTATSEAGDPNSPLSQYRQMLHLRRQLPALADLDNAAIEEILPGVVQVTRGASFTCVVNCSDALVQIATDASVLVVSHTSVMADGTSVTLPPATGAWLAREN
jgi:alpha-glucosidase